MKPARIFVILLAAFAGALGLGRAQEPAAGLPLLDLKAPGAERRLTVRDAQESVTASPDAATPGSVVAIKPGPDKFPGIRIPAEGAPWDLAKYGYVEARLANLGAKPLVLTFSIAGKEPGTSSVENVRLAPGKTETVRVYFGWQWGSTKGNFDPSAVPELLLFTKTVTEDVSFRIEAVTAAGKPGDKPAANPGALRAKPPGGILLGGTAVFDADKQVVTKGGATALPGADGKSQELAFTGGKAESATFRPAAGMWDLGDHLQVRVKLKNIGARPVTPGVQLESRGGPSTTVTAAAPLAPGTETEITVPFAAALPWRGVVEKDQDILELKKSFDGVTGTGTKFTSHLTTGVTLFPDKTEGAKKLQVTAIVADLPGLDLPAWLGQRPPVAGEWTKTFEDNFDGNTLDLHKWNLYAANYGDKRMHFSKDNVIVKDGTLRLRFEKKRGRHNDDPAGAETDYATGWVDTYGKWVQRYGYFESRMKLARAPSLFPAFWLMPDRGLKAGPQPVRADTKKGAMEFDILENLSIWGPYRYNIAMHWDGYMKYHKSIGTACNYIQADKDGFITVGMLWTPGSAVFYANGREVARWESPRISNVPSYLIFDHVMGGWEAEAIDDKQLPQDLIIDYVRAWQRQDLASPVDGPIPNRGTPGEPVE